MKRISQRQLKELQQTKHELDLMKLELDVLAATYADAKEEYNAAFAEYQLEKTKVYS